MREAGARVTAMKPVAGIGATDVAQLQEACGVVYPLALMQPVTLPDDAVPLVSGRRARAPVDIAKLDAAFAELCSMGEAIVVEDSGGLLVPITETENFATLFARWGLDLVIVSRNSPGTINDVLLTVQAARAAGLRVRAVVLTTLTEERGGTAERTNQAVLKELLLTIPVVSVPYSRTPTDPRQVAAFARDLVAQPTIPRPA
jgi:dethiobiotin synthetase